MSEQQTMGRPTLYTKELALGICTRLALGESLNAICRDAGMPAQSSVFNWLHSHSEFLEMYTRAREMQCETLIDECVDIADDAANDLIEMDDGKLMQYNVTVARAKLRVETRMKFAAQVAPRKYGTKRHEVAGAGGEPLFEQLSKVEIARRIGLALVEGAEDACGGNQQSELVGGDANELSN